MSRYSSVREPHQWLYNAECFLQTGEEQGVCSGSTGEMKELRTLILGGRACNLRVRHLAHVLRISESQFPQLQNGDGVLPARTCCHWNEIMVAKHMVNDEVSAHG